MAVDGPGSQDREKMKELERGVRELPRVNEIPRKASACFAQAEVDRRRRQWCPSSTRTEGSTESSQVLPIAPSTYYERMLQEEDPFRRSLRARRYEELEQEINAIELSVGSKGDSYDKALAETMADSTRPS